MKIKEMVITTPTTEFHYTGEKADVVAWAIKYCIDNKEQFAYFSYRNTKTCININHIVHIRYEYEVDQ